MILTYSFDKFVPAILSGEKIHTIREDFYERWKPGMSIQHWRGNPRNVKSNPYQFAVGECKGVQDITIRLGCKKMKHGLTVLIGKRFLADDEIEELAKNDGLTIDEFRKWFLREPGNSWFQGRIIHFTDFRY